MNRRRREEEEDGGTKSRLYNSITKLHTLLTSDVVTVGRSLRNSLAHQCTVLYLSLQWLIGWPNSNIIFWSTRICSSIFRWSFFFFSDLCCQMKPRAVYILSRSTHWARANLSRCWIDRSGEESARKLGWGFSFEAASVVVLSHRIKSLERASERARESRRKRFEAFSLQIWCERPSSEKSKCGLALSQNPVIGKTFFSDDCILFSHFLDRNSL